MEEVGGRNESPAGAAVSLHPEVRGVRAVLFDVGGTLLHPDWERLARLAEAEAGRALGSVELQRAFKDLIRRVDVAMCDGSPLPYDTGRRGWVFQSMYGALGLDDESCARLSLTVDAAHAERHLWCGLDGDAPRVLDALRAAGFAVAAISNTEDGRLEELLEMAGLGQKFDFALDSFHV
ncbi:MAG: HAD family hydrolase, partial [Pyrinomonadaceae bacterium]